MRPSPWHSGHAPAGVLGEKASASRCGWFGGYVPAREYNRRSELEMVVTLPTVYTVAGCAMPPPPAGNGPCVTAQFLMGATRVMAGGQPELWQDSQAICTPTGTPLNIVVTQVRVKGT